MIPRSKKLRSSSLITAVLLIALSWSSAKAADFSLIADHSDLEFHSTLEVFQGNYLLLRQGKLQELDYNGKVVRTMSLDKGFWSDAEQQPDQNLYSASFTATDGKKTGARAWPAIFKMTAIFGTNRITTIEPFASCANCSGTSSGVCQNTRGRCRDVTSPNSCPRNFTACSTEVVTERDILTFSVALSDWVFQDASNTLRLQIALKPKKDKDVFPAPKGSRLKVNLEESGLISLPNYAFIDDLWQNEQVQSADNTATFDKEKVIIEFNIPAFEEGSAYYNFDPDLNL